MISCHRGVLGVGGGSWVGESECWTNVLVRLLPDWPEERTHRLLMDFFICFQGSVPCFLLSDFNSAGSNMPTDKLLLPGWFRWFITCFSFLKLDQWSHNWFFVGKSPETINSSSDFLVMSWRSKCSRRLRPSLVFNNKSKKERHI